MKILLKKESELFLSFIKESKLLLGVILFYIILSYGIKLVYLDYSIDTEVILNNYELQLGAWETIGRLGLVFTKVLLFLKSFNPFMANFLTYITFTLVCLLLSYLVQRILDVHAKKTALFIIPIMFLTHPIFAEQFNFILQSFEVTLGILFICVALLCCYNYVQSDKKIFALISIVLLIWGFLTYQSLLLFFIAGTIASFILILYVHNKENDVKNFKTYFVIILKYFLIFTMSLVLSQLIVYVYSKLAGIPSSSYLSRQIIWGKLPVADVIDTINDQINNVIFAKGIFYNYSLLISACLVFAILVFKLVNRNQSVFLEMLAFIVLYITPFLLTIVIGQSEAIRAQMPALQFVIAFSFYYIYLHIHNSFLQKIFLVLCIIIAFRQSNVTANLLFSEHLKFQEDVSIANRINVQLDSMGVGNRSNYALVIVGKHEPESILTIQGETLGHSFFAWDIGTKQGTSIRAIGFMRTVGYLFKDPTEEQIDYALSMEKQLGVWPEKDSIKIENDLIIIKLSNDHYR